MQKVIKYTIFKTRWGYFGLAGTEFALLRTHLPDPKRENVKAKLLKNLPAAQYNKNLFKPIQEQIAAYFEGSYVNFSRDIPIVLDDCISICHSRASLSSTPIGGGNPQTTGNGKSAQILPVQRITEFTKQVLTACRDTRFGQTISYIQLAHKINRPGAARAVGSALAKNPLPLIIPCHRVVRSNGKIGGFSAPGGTELKAKLLRHEQKLSR